MKRLLELVAKIKQRKRDACCADPSRHSRAKSSKASRGRDGFPVLVLIISTMLLTLQQADALDARRSVAAVGDLITFRPGRSVVAAALPIIPARVVTSPWAPPTRSCRLNMGQITHHWGAFTVLAVRSDGVMLSWAGGATAKGDNNCAPAHKLLVSIRGYDELLSARRSHARFKPR